MTKLFAALGKLFARPPKPKTYSPVARFQCGNCHDFIKLTIPVGTRVQGWTQPCPSCGVEVRVR